MDQADFQQGFKTDLIQWAHDRSRIRMILQVGSLTRKVHPGDAYSDLDLHVCISEGEFAEQVEELLGWMHAYRPVWAVVEERHGEVPAWLFLYQGGYKVDVDAVPIAALEKVVETQELWEEMARGYEVLLDKDGIGPQMPKPKYFTPPRFTQPDEAHFVQRVRTFYYGAVYVAQQIKRKNLWKAKWADVYQQSFLLEMLEWHAHANSDNPVDTWFRGDFMQEWVSEETWEAVHGVFGHFDAADSRRALLASIALYSRLAEETAKQWGYALPEEMIVEVQAYLGNLFTA
jgi:aminoglycoside 6-adenylyltransferase